ncbi:MAG: FAD-dependent oxidoreductase [Verrucomicrobia bacterium]|nr:FAD-dependent oxidoreductase [Verrucomicrobiota bacterium]MBV8484060.1 FAD-dependent oxidoreductase [Verrucomicrobiota bacterium]
MITPHVIVIGAGSTGSATAHDLALRGLHVTVIERGEVAFGTTGRNHCLLHSGGRYCVTDQESAIECIDENLILRRIMPDLLELNDGLFVAVTESDLAFKERFLEGCAACHIPAHEVTVARALAMEPFLNPTILAAIQIPDGVFEPFRFCLSFLATALKNGATVRTFTEVTDFVCSDRNPTGVKIRDFRTGKTETIGGDIIVNAAGPWAGEIAAKAGVSVPEVPTAGVMVALDCRLNNMVLNRLNKPSDGDIVVPQRATSVIGTTSWKVEDPDLITIPPEHVERMISQGEKLIPTVRRVPMRAKMAVARPLIAMTGTDARELSRTFECFDHARDGVNGFVTITGGKTTTARAMAERVSDIVCQKLNHKAECRTREVPLTSYRFFFERQNVLKRRALAQLQTSDRPNIGFEERT